MKFGLHLRYLAVFTMAMAGANLLRGSSEMPVSSISIETALADAKALAAQHPNLAVMRIEGVSMLPYFGDGSVVVVKKINSAKLHAGMVVVYQNRFGETVAHRLVAQVEGGWQVRGWNNDRPDTTLVNESNLLGVVYATFHSRGIDHRSPALYAANMSQVQVALAAPAK